MHPIQLEALAAVCFRQARFPALQHLIASHVAQQCFGGLGSAHFKGSNLV